MKKCVILAAVLALLSQGMTALAAPAPSAGACIVMHADTGEVLYEYNADVPMLIASTTKIMTAAVVLENCELTDSVAVSKSCTLVEGSSAYLKAGESYTVEQLLYAMLLASGNDAALALAEHTAGDCESFVRLMNAMAERLGMVNSSFRNPHGLDEDGHCSTARDLAVLTAYCMENADFARIVSTVTYTLGENTYTNHNRLLVMRGDVIGVKTGYTAAAGRSLVSCAERDGTRYICVTLSDPDDWNDHCALYDWAFAAARYSAVVTPEQSFELPVISGETDAVSVSPERELRALVRGAEDVRIAVELPAFVFAPVEAGETVGRIRVLSDGELVDECALITTGRADIQNGIELTAAERFGRVWRMAGNR